VKQENEKVSFLSGLMVLPEWIEHSTSPLPRGCSTTELRQRRASEYPIVPVMSSVPLAGGGPAFYPLQAMTGGSGKSGNSQRAERLKTALRDNLKRRKSQAKARSQAAARAAERDSAGITPEIAPAKPKG
jgi:hypothetical protein